MSDFVVWSFVKPERVAGRLVLHPLQPFFWDNPDLAPPDRRCFEQALVSDEGVWVRIDWMRQTVIEVSERPPDGAHRLGHRHEIQTISWI